MHKNMQKPEWAQRVRALRLSLGMSQGAFGECFGGISGVAVSNWERGKNEPRVANYIRMGNMALRRRERLWFWAKAGIDIALLSKAQYPKPTDEEGAD
jgi:transcriptional regulator with XRE-family HTH domain